MIPWACWSLLSRRKWGTIRRSQKARSLSLPLSVIHRARRQIIHGKSRKLQQLSPPLERHLYSTHHIHQHIFNTTRTPPTRLLHSTTAKLTGWVTSNHGKNGRIRFTSRSQRRRRNNLRPSEYLVERKPGGRRVRIPSLSHQVHLEILTIYPNQTSTFHPAYLYRLEKRFIRPAPPSSPLQISLRLYTTKTLMALSHARPRSLVIPRLTMTISVMSSSRIHSRAQRGLCQPWSSGSKVVTRFTLRVPLLHGAGNFV